MVHAVEMAILTVDTSCMFGSDDHNSGHANPVGLILGVFDARLFLCLDDQDWGHYDCGIRIHDEG